MTALAKLVFAFGALPSVVYGQSADVRLSSIATGLVITQTTSPRLTLTVTNHGPNASSGVRVESLGGVPLDQLVVSSANDCEVAAGASSLAWTPGTLLQGQSTDCTLTLRALPTAVAASLRLSFRAIGTTPDPIPFNNTISHIYAISAFEIAVDAAVDATLSPAGAIAPGDVRRLVVRLRNDGPDAAASIKAVSSPVPRGIIGGDPFILTPAPGSPCATFYEDLGPVTQLDVFPLEGLAGRTSVNCLLDVRTSRFAASRNDVTFTAFVSGIGVVDANRDNDQSVVSIQVGFVPSAVPGPGWQALLLAAMIMFATGIITGSRQGRGGRGFALPTMAHDPGSRPSE